MPCAPPPATGHHRPALRFFPFSLSPSCVLRLFFFLSVIRHLSRRALSVTMIFLSRSLYSLPPSRPPHPLFFRSRSFSFSLSLSLSTPWFVSSLRFLRHASTSASYCREDAPRRCRSAATTASYRCRAHSKLRYSSFSLFLFLPLARARARASYFAAVSLSLPLLSSFSLPLPLFLSLSLSLLALVVRGFQK